MWSTLSYGAAIRGDRSVSCIQNRAARYFMGVGPYTPNTPIMEVMGRLSTEVKQWDHSVLNHWHRLRTMEESRANFKVFKLAVENGNKRCKTLVFQFKTAI